MIDSTATRQLTNVAWLRHRMVILSVASLNSFNFLIHIIHLVYLFVSGPINDPWLNSPIFKMTGIWITFGGWVLATASLCYWITLRNERTPYTTQIAVAIGTLLFFPLVVSLLVAIGVWMVGVDLKGFFFGTGVGP